MMKIKPISDREVIETGKTRFIPNYADDHYFVDENLKIAKGGLFDPDVFGPTELINFEDTRKVNKCGKNGAYYHFSEMVWNPLYIYNLFKELGCSDEDAYCFAVGSSGLGIDIAKTKDLTPIAYGKPECRFWGDSMARMVALLFNKEFPENGIGMNELYILPPRLRPICRISDEDKRIRVAEINMHYRMIMMRDHRLEKLSELKAPPVILHNERIMLHSAILRLMINEELPNPITTSVFGDEYTNEKPLKSLNTLMSQVSNKDRELVATAMHISADTTATVRQVRIDKYTLDEADRIFNDNDTNFSEVIRILIEKIVSTGELPDFIKKAVEWNRLTPEVRLFKAIFEGDDDIPEYYVREWAANLGISPDLSTDTLRDLFNNDVIPHLPDDPTNEAFNEAINAVKNNKDDNQAVTEIKAIFAAQMIEQRIDLMACAMKARAMREIFGN